MFSEDDIRRLREIARRVERYEQEVARGNIFSWMTAEDDVAFLWKILKIMKNEKSLGDGDNLSTRRRQDS